MLTVPWGTLAAFSGEPGQLSRIGPVTPAVARELAEAAGADATCEWRVVVAGARGQPLVVTRIRSPGCARAGPAHLGLLGRVIVTVPVSLLDPPHPPHPLSIPDPGAGHLAAVIRAVLEAGRAALAREPAGNAPGACTHRHMVPGYRVPGRMRAFIEARDQDCGYPVCRRPAASCDIDHTTPYDQGGLTCSCNLYPQCRRHHQLKQLPTWRLTQPRPGTLIWRTPAGLTYPAGPAPDAG